MTTTITSTSSIGIYPNASVLTLFESIARDTWEWLGQARQHQVSFSEETVTDIAALQIVAAANNHIKMTKTTKRQEKQSGIDWMWFIGNQAQGYVRYAVQAKKMTLGHSKMPSYKIQHRVKGVPGVKFQIEVLERFARRSRAIPLYCFYNNVEQALATKHWHCLTYPNQADVQQMGCTIVPLDAVQLVHEPYHKKGFASIHKDSRSIPWRCLFHPICVAANIHSTPVYRQRASTSQLPQEDSSSAPTPGSLPEFLSQDGSVVEFTDVIEQLGLTGIFGDVDSEAGISPSGLLGIPEWFVVIESELGQSARV